MAVCQVLAAGVAITDQKFAPGGFIIDPAVAPLAVTGTRVATAGARIASIS